MTNSFFNFTESPDFGSILEDSYSSVNTSYDRREELEQENDKTRLKNAEMPLEIIKELIELSRKAKKIADELAWNKYNKDSAAKNPWPEGSPQYEEYKKLQLQLDRAEKLNSEMLGDAYKKEDIIGISFFKT